MKPKRYRTAKSDKSTQISVDEATEQATGKKQVSNHIPKRVWMSLYNICSVYVPSGYMDRAKVKR